MTTLEEAKAWLREQVDGEGARCPCCSQFAKVYRWSLYSTAVHALILFYQLGGQSEFVHSRELKAHGHTGQGDASRLRNWGLVEEEKARREDGGRSGWWRVTNLGGSFVRGTVRIPKYAYVYDNRVLRFDGPEIDIREALGSRFNYSELMNPQQKEGTAC